LIVDHHLLTGFVIVTVTFIVLEDIGSSNKTLLQYRRIIHTFFICCNYGILPKPVKNEQIYITEHVLKHQGLKTVL